MKINMKKFAKWVDPQGKIVKITPQYVVINKRPGTFEKQYWQSNINEKYTRKEIIQIYSHLSSEEKKGIDWVE